MAMAGPNPAILPQKAERQTSILANQGLDQHPAWVKEQDRNG
jgi:hypothetical protein